MTLEERLTRIFEELDEIAIAFNVDTYAFADALAFTDCAEDFVRKASKILNLR